MPTPCHRRSIDRVVHHSGILEFDVPSYQTDVAQQRGQDKEVNRQIWLTPDRQECLTRYDSDASCLVSRAGNRIMAIETHHGMSTIELTGHVVQAIRKLPDPHCQRRRYRRGCWRRRPAP